MRCAQIIATAVVFLMGCGSYSPNQTPAPPCQNDSDCESGWVCFISGCAEPDKDILIEVETSVGENQAPQEVYAETLSSVQDISLPEQPFLRGMITRVQNAGATPVPFDNPVSFRVFGESLYVPGLFRSYQATLTPNRSDGGRYRLAIGVGQHQVVVTPQADVTIPPFSLSRLSIYTGQSVTLNVELPARDALSVLGGALLKQSGGTPIPVGVAMTVQALDFDTQAALSQRITVKESDGTFSLYISPNVRLKDKFWVRAAPETQGPVPTRLFELSTDTAFATPVALNLGEFGATVSASGVLMGSQGSPLVGASIFVEGTVKGGGSYRSPSTTTTAGGRFVLQTLPSDGMTFLLWAIPPAKSTSSILKAPVDITSTGMMTASSPLLCPGRVPVTGRVLYPDQSNAVGARIVAQPLDTLATLPLPSTMEEVTVNERGMFEMPLDSAVYRFEFRPPPGRADLPRVSRIFDVNALPDPAVPSVMKPVELPDVVLSKGRVVRGTILATPVQGSPASEPAKGAVIRFFKVSTSYKTMDARRQPAAAPLAEAVADENGGYTVTLPDR